MNTRFRCSWFGVLGQVLQSSTSFQRHRQFCNPKRHTPEVKPFIAESRGSGLGIWAWKLEDRQFASQTYQACHLLAEEC